MPYKSSVDVIIAVLPISLAEGTTPLKARLSAPKAWLSTARKEGGSQQRLHKRVCLQERTEGHNLQGRDSTAQYFYRNSMADPEYTVNDSRRQRLVPRGLVTPTVHVAEGTRPCCVPLWG